MVIEHKWSLWKPSLFTQCRSKSFSLSLCVCGRETKTRVMCLVRVANELRLAQRQNRGNELREQITLANNGINALLAQMTPIDFARIDQVRPKSPHSAALLR